MVTLSSCLIWQIISYILPPNEYVCVYAWTTLGNIATDRLTEGSDFGKNNHLFSWSSFGSWRVCIQAKLLLLRHTKSARIHWKADALKNRYCLVRILVQRHNWAIFLRKWAVNGSLSGHIERIFVHKNWRGYWQHLVSTGRRYVPHCQIYTRCFATCFWRSHCQPQSWCRLATSELSFDTVVLLFVGCRQK